MSFVVEVVLKKKPEEWSRCAPVFHWRVEAEQMGERLTSIFPEIIAEARVRHSHGRPNCRLRHGKPQWL